MNELDLVANLPEEIKIGDKVFKIKAPSIGIAALVARKMKVLLDLIEFDIDKYDRQTTSLQQLVSDILRGIYRVIVSERIEQAVDVICQIIALLINNSPEEKIITSEEIKWNFGIDEFVPLLTKVLKMTDLSDFFLLTLRTAMAYDVEGILSGSAKSSSVSHKQQGGQSTT